MGLTSATITTSTAVRDLFERATGTKKATNQWSNRKGKNGSLGSRRIRQRIRSGTLGGGGEARRAASQRRGRLLSKLDTSAATTSTTTATAAAAAAGSVTATASAGGATAGVAAAAASAAVAPRGRPAQCQLETPTAGTAARCPSFK